jgi:hypothetical protein
MFYARKIKEEIEKIVSSDTKVFQCTFQNLNGDVG